MTMIRKTVLATAIVGAGLGSLSGVAMAHTHAPSGCSNAVQAENSNGTDRTLGDTTGGDQDFDLSNLCDIANGNTVDSGNNTATDGGTITNGDTTTSRETNTSNETSNTTTDGTAPAAGFGDFGDILDAIFGA